MEDNQRLLRQPLNILKETRVRDALMAAENLPSPACREDLLRAALAGEPKMPDDTLADGMTFSDATQHLHLLNSLKPNSLTVPHMSPYTVWNIANATNGRMWPAHLKSLIYQQASDLNGDDFESIVHDWLAVMLDLVFNTRETSTTLKQLFSRPDYTPFANNLDEFDDFVISGAPECSSTVGQAAAGHKGTAKRGVPLNMLPMKKDVVNIMRMKHGAQAGCDILVYNSEIAFGVECKYSADGVSTSLSKQAIEGKRKKFTEVCNNPDLAGKIPAAPDKERGWPLVVMGLRKVDSDITSESVPDNTLVVPRDVGRALLTPSLHVSRFLDA